MTLVQQGSTLNTATGDTTGYTYDHYNTVMADGSVALYVANGSGVASLRFMNAAGELIREMNTPGFSVVRDMVALPDGGLFIVGFPNAGVANGGIVAQVINADGTLRTPGPVTITTNTQGGVGGGVGADMQAALLPTGEIALAWQSTKDFSLTFNPLVTRLTGGGAGTSVGSAPAGHDIYAGKVNPNALANIGDGTLIHAGVDAGPDYQVADRRAGVQYLADIDVMADGDVLITYLGDRYTYGGAAVRMANYVEFNPHSNAIIVPQRAISDNPIIGTQSFQGVEYQFAKSVMLGTNEIGSFAAQYLPSNPSFTYSAQMLRSAPNTGFAQIGSFVNIGLNFTSGSPIAGFEPLPHGANDFVAAYTFYDAATAQYDIKIRHYNASGIVQSEIDVANGPTNEWAIGFSKGEDNSYIVTYRVQSGERITKRYIVTEAGAVDAQTGGVSGDLIQLGAGNDWGSGEGGNDTVRGFGSDDHLFGGQGNDSLDGGTGNDELFGGDADDTLEGGAGNDTMHGGFGNDRFHVDSLLDVVADSGGNDLVVTSLNNYVLGADIERLQLGGSAGLAASGNGMANEITGNTGANVLFGLGGNDTLLGGLGNDTLAGGTGKDQMTGGGGLDRMVLTSLADSGVTFASRDIINTFAHGDKIDLSAIDARTNVAGDQAFTFIGTTAFSGVSGQLRFDMTNISVTGVKAYTVYGDVNGDRAADFSLQIFTSPTSDRTGQPQTWNLFAWDFIL